ncbi:MAG: hypothetical protein WD875_00045, partial [Pirellulales bacterium]
AAARMRRVMEELNVPPRPQETAAETHRKQAPAPRLDLSSTQSTKAGKIQGQRVHLDMMAESGLGHAFPAL